jgi:hypothetical protein
MTMEKEEPKKTLVRFPLSIDVKNARTVETKVLEIDPNRIKVGEVVIVKAANWGGLKNQFFAVMNVDGRYMRVEQLDSRKRRRKKRSKPR